MSLKLSTGLRNAMLSVGSFKGSMDTCTLKIYSGTVPATADADISATGLNSPMLCEIFESNDGSTTLTFDAATGADIAKAVAEAWAGTNALSGTAAFYRLELAADTQVLSTTQLRVQGEIGTSGKELNLTSTVLTQSSVQNIDYFSLNFPSL